MMKRIRLLTMTTTFLASAAHAGPRPANAPPEGGRDARPTASTAPRPAAPQAGEETQAPEAAPQQALTPEREAAEWASRTLGAEVYGILVDKRYLVVQSPKENPRFQDAQWEALAELGRLSMAAKEFGEAYARFFSGNPAVPAGAALEFTPLLTLPESGLMTPALHSAARLIIAGHSEFSALDPKALASDEGTTLFETPWGASFAARTRADLSPDPGNLADAFFEDHLAAVQPDGAAVEHLKKHLRTVYGKDAGALIETDTRNASLSGDLRGWIKKYLLDQRRLRSLKRYHAAVARLDAKLGLASQIAELDAAASALAAHPDFTDILQKKRSRTVSPAESPKTRLTATELHLHQPVRLDRHETGDTVVLTAGYWVDGLAEGENAEISETTFVDYGKHGFSEESTRRVRRSNGGLYEIRREVPLLHSRPFAFRFIVSGAETNTISGKVGVPVSDAFDHALDALTAADALALDCRFKEAEEAYSAFAGVFAESAKAKKQYADLLAAAGKRRQEALQNASALAKLEEAISASRSDLSPEKCEYGTARTEAAIKMIAAMPAGCDRFLADLHGQLRTIRKRRSDQAAFRESVSKARDLEKSCQLTASADSLAHGLAILDANPSTRCGSIDEAAKKVEADLPAARLSALWGETLSKSVEEGEAPPQPGNDPTAASLKIVNAALARLPTLPNSGCYNDQKEALLRVADSSGLSLAAPEDGAAGRLLPNDDKLAAVSASVMDEIRRIEEAKEAALHRKAQLELPAAESAPSPEAQPKQIEKHKAAAGKPAKAAANKAETIKPETPKPARRAVKRQAKPKTPADSPKKASAEKASEVKP
ncbi:MAG: hypothetical protein HZB91_06830 [Elusimicrobia bacterium]|nr:hypothetical protein [Elusimicrobiota bacterium]